jgi:hypothetical protein
MKRIFYNVFILAGISLNLSAQQCGTMDYLNARKQEDPQLESRLHQLEQTQHLIETSLVNKANREVIRIPVVVHVVYKAAAENISDEQVISQIQILNQDYRRQNADAGQTPELFQGVAADTEIEFCLATRDPSGQPTNGITRTQTNANSFIQNDGVKRTATGGIDAWPSSKYVNIWVCNLESPLLGFGTLPGTASPENDGVVIKYKNFGNIGVLNPLYNKGRTTTHEVGHFLNLLHTWGDDEGSSDNCAGTDLIFDTPNQATAHFGCPAYPQPSCGNTCDMYMNYMDYTNDRCMNLFTKGQKLRMLATLNGFRLSLLSSDGCVPALTAEDCDTLDNISGGDGLVYYYASEIDPIQSGYFTGTSSKNQKAFAEGHTTAAIRVIHAIRFDFAVASASNAAGFITATVWDNDGINGAPGTALAQQQVFLSDIEQNVQNYTFTDVQFTNPAQVIGDYFVGFQLYENPGDTIAVYSNQFDSTNVNSGWFKNTNNAWNRYDELNADSALSLAMRPIACLDVGIAPVKLQTINLFPNPGNGTFFIEQQDQNPVLSWQLFSIDGKLVSGGYLQPSSQQMIETGCSRPGIYFLKLAMNRETCVKKVIIVQ